MARIHVSEAQDAVQWMDKWMIIKLLFITTGTVLLAITWKCAVSFFKVVFSFLFVNISLQHIIFIFIFCNTITLQLSSYKLLYFMKLKHLDSIYIIL